MTKTRQLGPAMAVLATMAAMTPALAGGPVPPCGTAASPAPAAAGPVPELRLWAPDEVAAWRPPACTGWQQRAGARVVATSGMVRGSAEAILVRLGAASRQIEMRYWSAGRGAWRPLLEDAAALAGPDPASRRADFRAEELGAGAVAHLYLDDAEPIAGVVHELVVRERTADRVVVATRNVTAARAWRVLVAGEGDLEVVIFLDRVGPDTWHYYALSRFALRLPAISQPADIDFLNRATAMFRWVAGIATDVEPPALPGKAAEAPAFGPVAARDD
jgi:hypothetical protein